MKIKNIIFIVIFLVGCKVLDTNEKKIIDTGKFEIEVPANWEYVKANGTDSFVGYITNNKDVELEFDWSEMGYANQLVLTTDEYISDGRWKPINPPYMKTGITYTSGDVAKERKRIMKNEGITDSTLVKVEKIQIPKTEIFFKEGRYTAMLTYRDTFQKVEIKIPEETQQHQFQIDTVDGYYRKIVRPQTGVKGTTGVYFQYLNSGFNFQISGSGLSIENQEKAIAAFKTIKIKRN